MPSATTICQHDTDGNYCQLSTQKPGPFIEGSGFMNFNYELIQLLTELQVWPLL
jgi:hypothetical protein